MSKEEEEEGEADGDDGKNCFGVDMENERESGMNKVAEFEAEAAAEQDAFCSPLFSRSPVLCNNFSANMGSMSGFSKVEQRYSSPLQTVFLEARTGKY
eukprot:scaffold20208_cov15-Tisochrysis_lutea.AAC.1